MDTKKLFQVLVAGGALLAVGCLEDNEPAHVDAGSRPEDGAVRVDAASAAEDAADAAVLAEQDAGELMNCGLCPNTECCVTEPDGSAHEQAGMMCCWGTSC